jgi:hypothetical protein
MTKRCSTGGSSDSEAAHQYVLLAERDRKRSMPGMCLHTILGMGCNELQSQRSAVNEHDPCLA